MKNLVKKSILKIKPYVGGKPIEEVKRELRLKSVVKLASNENPYGVSPKVAQAISRATRDLNRYPDGNCFYLRDALAKKLKVKPQQLIFGNGSDEVIVFAARAFLKPGDEVVIAKPSFLIYELVSKLESAKIKAVPLKKDFRYDLEAMKKAVTRKTKIVFLGNPDNPAGWYFTEKEIKSFLKGLSPNVIVFIDEAYFEYVAHKDYVDSLKLLKRHKNVIVTRTFSKMYGLAGLRVGYGIAHPEMIDYLNRVREPFNVNSLAQVGALAALKDKPFYTVLAKKVEKQRQYLYKNLEALNYSYVESCTNFIMIKVGKGASALVKALLKKGVIVRDMSAWGMTDYLRVSIGTATENRKFINTLKSLKK